MKHIYISIIIALFVFDYNTGIAQVIYKDTLQTGFYTLNDIPNTYIRQLYLSDKKYFIDPVIKIGTNNIKKISLNYNKFHEGKETPELVILMDSLGTIKLKELTQSEVGNELGFVLNDTLIYVATIMGEISDGSMSIVNIEYNKYDIEGFIKALQPLIDHDK